MEVRSKVWLEKNGKLFFGSGRLHILKNIEESGSISKAANRINMSYRRAWSYIHSAEKSFGKPFLVRLRGGKEGGGAALTQQAKELMKKFGKLQNDVKEFTDRRLKEIFNGIL